jgi:transcriptional regulator with XRE-family HTH domain
MGWKLTFIMLKYKQGCVIMIYITLGNNIRMLRVKKHLTQEKLAELSNITQKYLSLIELGNAKARLEVYINIAKALGVTLDFLLSDSQHNEVSLYINSLTTKINALSIAKQKILLNILECFDDYSLEEIKK